MLIEILDKSLKIAKQSEKDTSDKANVLLYDISYNDVVQNIELWAKKQSINIIYKNISKLSQRDIKILQEEMTVPNSILVLDNYNDLTKEEFREFYRKLIKDSIFIDPQTGTVTSSNTLLFTIAFFDSKKEPLNIGEKSCFMHVERNMIFQNTNASDKDSQANNIKFIVLTGASNTGKTYTLKHLIQLLLADPTFKLFDFCENFYYKLYNYIPDSHGNMPDVWAKFCYKGIHIVITTKGDSPTDVVSEFERHKLGCDIFVCACHNTTVSIKAVKQLGATDADFITKKTVIDKANKSSWMQMNNAQAIELLNAIKTLI